jgi:hypothetical protein
LLCLLKVWTGFGGGRAKVERGKEHIRRLEQHIDAFQQREPYGVVLEANPTTPGHTQFVQRVREDVPDAVSLSLGDAVHNLRAALDHAICAAVRIAGNTVTSAHQFPFYKHGTVGEAIQSRHIEDAGREVVRVIERIDPSKDNQPALWMPHDLDVADKHRLLIPGLAVVDVLGFSLAGRPDTPRSYYARTTDVQDGMVYLVVPGPVENWPLNLGVAQKFELQLPPAAGVPAEPMGRAPRAVAATVADVVEQIAAATRAAGSG